MVNTAKKLLSSEIGILLAFFVVIAGVWGFVEIADEIVEGETQRFDNFVLDSLRGGEGKYRSQWLSMTMRDITALGSGIVLCLAIIIVTGFLALIGQFRYVSLILAASASGGTLVLILKALFGRQRPEALFPGLVLETSPGFPSGHATLSAAVYLSLAVLLTRILPGISMRIYVIGVAIAVTLLIGVSRIYLGVHYPSDVLAGWSIGFAWACFWWLVTRFLEQRGKMRL